MQDSIDQLLKLAASDIVTDAQAAYILDDMVLTLRGYQRSNGRAILADRFVPQARVQTD